MVSGGVAVVQTSDATGSRSLAYPVFQTNHYFPIRDNLVFNPTLFHD